MTHPIGERDLVKHADSKEQMALDSFGAGIMFAGRRTKPSLRLVNCLFSSNSLKQADLFDPYVELGFRSWHRVELE